MNKKLLPIKVFFSGVLLFYLFSQIQLTDLFHRLKSINTIFLLIALGISFIQLLLSSLKWKIILGALKKIPFRFLLQSYLLGGFISLFLPSSFGGDFYRAYSLRKYNLNLINNISSVLFDRLSGLFALASISFLSYFYYNRTSFDNRYLLIYFLSIVLFWFFSSKKLLIRLSKCRSKILSYAVEILKSFNEYRSDYKVLFLSIAIAFLFHGNIVLLNKLYCVALGIEIPLSYLFVIIPLVYLTEVLPISINGFGVRESAFVFFFVQKGYAKEDALALSVLVISMRYFFSLITGGLIFFKVFVIEKSVAK